MSRALVPLADGFEDIEAITIVDVLRRGGVEVVTASISQSLAVKSAHGITMKADALFTDVAQESFAAIVLPGGGPGTERLINYEPLAVLLQRQRDEGRLIAAICAAPTVLADAGVLEDSQYVTCYPTCRDQINCQWVDQPVVEHEGIITGQGPGSALIFSLVVLQALVGKKASRLVAQAMIADVMGGE